MIRRPTHLSPRAALWLAGDLLFMEAGMSCCQAPRHICWVCDSSAAGLDSVFSLSQKGGMSTDCQTQPAGPAIQHLSADEQTCTLCPKPLTQVFTWTSPNNLNALNLFLSIFLSSQHRPPVWCVFTSALYRFEFLTFFSGVVDFSVLYLSL